MYSTAHVHCTIIILLWFDINWAKEHCPPLINLQYNVSYMYHLIISSYSHKPAQLLSSPNDWMAQVTTLDLTGLHIHKLSCLEQMINLRWLCLKDNALIGIEVLV